MKTITPCLWFDGNAEQAAELYCSLFPDSSITHVSYYGPENPATEGSVMTVSFRLRGQDHVGLNGGPQFPFTEAVSFQVHCESAEEVDHYWDGLVAGGEPGPCGWLKDRFGLSWQIIPPHLLEWLDDADREAAGRVAQVMLGTHGKLDLDALRKTHGG